MNSGTKYVVKAPTTSGNTQTTYVTQRNSNIWVTLVSDRLAALWTCLIALLFFVAFHNWSMLIDEQIMTTRIETGLTMKIVPTMAGIAEARAEFSTR